MSYEFIGILIRVLSAAIEKFPPEGISIMQYCAGLEFSIRHALHVHGPQA